MEYIDFSDAHESKIVSPFGSFNRAFDFFGDGSFYIVDAPGHIPGHTIGCARVGPNAFAILAADTCHNRQCYHPGDRSISTFMYEDVKVAQNTVDRLKEAHADPNTLVILSHEHEYWQEIPTFPKLLNSWAMAKMAQKTSQE
jgi:glyoxylase-like metal-dependent hydrolase (beta-lactamase superfamily II)